MSQRARRMLTRKLDPEMSPWSKIANPPLLTHRTSRFMNEPVSMFSRSAMPLLISDPTCDYSFCPSANHSGIRRQKFWLIQRFTCAMNAALQPFGKSADIRLTQNLHVSAINLDRFQFTYIPRPGGIRIVCDAPGISSPQQYCFPLIGPKNVVVRRLGIVAHHLLQIRRQTHALPCASKLFA